MLSTVDGADEWLEAVSDLDYKLFPYAKDHYQDLMKDVIAMLNSEEGIGQKRPSSLAFLMTFRAA